MNQGSSILHKYVLHCVQFELPGNLHSVTDFVTELDVRKVPGVGKVGHAVVPQKSCCCPRTSSTFSKS